MSNQQPKPNSMSNKELDEAAQILSEKIALLVVAETPEGLLGLEISLRALRTNLTVLEKTAMDVFPHRYERVKR